MSNITCGCCREIIEVEPKDYCEECGIYFCPRCARKLLGSPCLACGTIRRAAPLWLPLALIAIVVGTIALSILFLLRKG